MSKKDWWLFYVVFMLTICCGSSKAFSIASAVTEQENGGLIVLEEDIEEVLTATIFDDSIDIGPFSIESADSLVFGSSGRDVFTIYRDGRIELAPDVTLDEATKAFWDFVQHQFSERFPSCGERKKEASGEGQDN